MTETKARFFTSKEEIMGFFNIKDSVFTQFMKLNMPVVVVSGRYYAYADNLEAWFKSLTAKQRTDNSVPEASPDH